jgi:hypothetical protein
VGLSRLLWSFPPTTTFTCFPAPGCWVVPPLLPSPAACLFTVLWEVSPPPFLVLRAPRPLCYIAYYSVFSFFPGWGSVCLGCYAGLALDCLWEYYMLLSSPCGLCLPQWCGHWHLVAWELSWFLHLTWSWDCYVWAGDVEESKFCLFLVVFPVRCISSISPRFYFRKHAFCFFSLVTILESPWILIES